MQKTAGLGWHWCFDRSSRRKDTSLTLQTKTFGRLSSWKMKLNGKCCLLQDLSQKRLEQGLHWVLLQRAWESKVSLNES